MPTDPLRRDRSERDPDREARAAPKLPPERASQRASPPRASGENAPALARDEFAWGALDFPAVLQVFEALAHTSLGARAVRDLVPAPDDEARHALARCEEACTLSAAGALPSLAGVSDPMPAIEHAHRAGRALEDESLLTIARFLEAVERLAEWLEELDPSFPALRDLARGLPDLAPLRASIAATIDERGRVRDEASPLLARVRRDERELAREIEAGLAALLARTEIRAVLSDSVPHRRGGRAVLAVRQKSAGRVPGMVHDRSQSGETVFVEPRALVLPGNRLAECEAEDRREVERVLLELTRAILRDLESIDECADRLARLELAMIGARYVSRPEVAGSSARGERGARAALVPGDPRAATGLVLRGARHPLLLEEVRLGRLTEVVPIDLRVGADFDVMVLTGPNTGGKTLALKTAGVFALMTRCGLPVPCAEGTTVPLYDRIVADIGDEQEISQSLSTFSSHLKRVRRGIETATSSSLVLLDELGGGTDPDEGAALSEAILECFLARGSATLATTHIGKLKEFAFRHTRVENASVEFDAQSLAPRYRLLVGTPGESGALVIARRLGLPPELVDEAQRRLVRRDAELTELMADVGRARQHAERVRSQAETHLEDASRKTRELDERLREVDQRGQSLEAEAQRGIEERVRDARRRLERIGALLGQIAPGPRREIEVELARLDDDLSGAALSERRESFLAALRPGSYVYLPRYRQRCVVSKVDRAKRQLVVRLGAMQLRVSFDEATWYESL